MKLDKDQLLRRDDAKAQYGPARHQDKAGFVAFHAQEIVRRWNAHADLVEAVELLLDGNGGDNGCAWCGGYVECEKSCDSHKARLALAKAKGGA